MCLSLSGSLGADSSGKGKRNLHSVRFNSFFSSFFPAPFSLKTDSSSCYCAWCGLYNVPHSSVQLVHDDDSIKSFTRELPPPSSSRRGNREVKRRLLSQTLCHGKRERRELFFLSLPFPSGKESTLRARAHPTPIGAFSPHSVDMLQQPLFVVVAFASLFFRLHFHSGSQVSHKLRNVVPSFPRPDVKMHACVVPLTKPHTQLLCPEIYLYSVAAERG